MGCLHVDEEKTHSVIGDSNFKSFSLNHFHHDFFPEFVVRETVPSSSFVFSGPLIITLSAPCPLTQIRCRWRTPEHCTLVSALCIDFADLACGNENEGASPTFQPGHDCMLLAMYIKEKWNANYSSLDSILPNCASLCSIVVVHYYTSISSIAHHFYTSFGTRGGERPKPTQGQVDWEKRDVHTNMHTNVHTKKNSIEHTGTAYRHARGGRASS